MRASKSTIIRTIVYLIALINMALTVTGNNPLPYPTEDIESAFTVILDVVAGLVGFWKNESFTKEAITSDMLMHTNKTLNKMTKGTDEAADTNTAEELSNGRGE